MANDRYSVVVVDRRDIVDGVSKGTPSYDGPDPYREVVESTGADFEYLVGGYDTEAELVEHIKDANVIVTFRTPISRNIIEQLEDPRLILRSGVGYEIIDVQAATEHGIPVANVPGAAGSTKSDILATHSIALMFAAAHDIVVGDRDMRDANGFGNRIPLNAMYGGTYGIIGFGYIGRAVVSKASALDMDVLVYDPYVKDDLFKLFDVERVELYELLERADCVDIHCNQTPETEGMISTKEFERMKEDAVLVNTARGPIVDEDAVVQAVETGEIYAAALDVFENEPPEDSPVLKCERIVCSPHKAGVAPEIERQSYEIAEKEILRALDDEAHCRYVVNPEAYYHGEGDITLPDDKKLG